MVKILKKIVTRDVFIASVLFLLAGLIRAVPEIKAGIWPIGYDTFNTYAAELATYHGPLINWLRTANLVYFIFLPFVKAGIDPGFLMKIFGPIFFGVLIVSFYFWSRHFLKFSPIKSLLAGLLLMLQLATLRLSWDLYRNELGLIFLFWALISLPKIEKMKHFLLFMLFGTLIVLSNELVAVIFLFVVLIYLLSKLYRKKYRFSLKLAIPWLIILLIFFINIFQSVGTKLYSPNVIFINERNNLWRYLYQYQQEMSYQMLFTTIGRLFWLLYQFILPLALYGYWLLRKNLVLTSITIWLLVGTFSSLIFAGTGLIVWERWLIMLVFPFTIYAVEGASKLGEIIGNVKHWASRYSRLAFVLGTLFWLVLLGIILFKTIPFITKDYVDAQPPLADDRLNQYFPRTMVHNSVGIWKIENTLECIEWLDRNVPPGAVVLVDNRYRGLMLTKFELDNRYIVTNSWSEEWSRKSYDFAKAKRFKNIYLIWSGQKRIRGFDKVFTKGNVSIYHTDLD